MKKIFVFALVLPSLVFAQMKPKSKPALITTSSSVKPIKLSDGFVINGDFVGFADGTTVALLNGQTGASEAETTITNNKFTLKGKAALPEFKVILFNKKPPYLTLFLDNSVVSIIGNSAAIEAAVVKGSASHSDYTTFNKLLVPYNKLFAENAAPDPVAGARAMELLDQYVQQNPASYVAPLAIIRYSQLNEDAAKMDALFSGLKPSVKASSLGSYIAQKIAETKQNAIGTLMTDFTQTDTLGTPLTLSSLRGKYVLVDFWASWCRPCRQENPNVLANFNQFKNKNFTVLGVSLDKSKASWLEAINSDGLNYWPHVSDLQGWTNAVAQQFGITSIPQNFLIDPKGIIVGKNLRGPDLEAKLNQLIK